MKKTNEKVFRPIRFTGIDVVNPHGTEHERRFLHPNAANIWNRKSY